MASYSVAITDSCAAVILSGAPSIQFKAFRFCGETVGTTVSTVRIFNINSVTSVIGANTAEKFNSRSPSNGATTAAVNGDGNSPTLTSTGLANFSHSALIFSGRYAPVALADGEGFVTLGLGNQSNSFSFSEDVGNVQRRLRRRLSKPGYFVRFGNEIHHQAKTGSGAYSMISPHFDNDITWIDPSAWQNGMNQSDVWNIQLYGTVPPVGFVINVPQSVKRAATF